MEKAKQYISPEFLFESKYVEVDGWRMHDVVGPPRYIRERRMI